MKSTQAVRTIMQNNNVSLTQVSDRLGKSLRLVSDRLRMDNISIDKLNEILRVLDYKIIVVPSNTRLPKDGIEI